MTPPTRAADTASAFGGGGGGGGDGSTPWREVHSPSGLRYFYHEATRETTWSPPSRYVPYGAETLASAQSPSLAAAKVRARNPPSPSPPPRRVSARALTAPSLRPSPPSRSSCLRVQIEAAARSASVVAQIDTAPRAAPWSPAGPSRTNDDAPMVGVQAQLEAALETMRAVAERGGAAGAAATGGYSDEAAEFSGGWYYIDENGEQQGKYTSATMRGWCVAIASAPDRLSPARHARARAHSRASVVLSSLARLAAGTRKATSPRTSPCAGASAVRTRRCTCYSPVG